MTIKLNNDFSDEVFVAVKAQAKQFPEDAGAHHQLASILYKHKKYDEAISSFSNSLRLDASRLETYLGLANCYVKIGKGNEALTTYELAIEENPDWLPPHICLGRIRRRLGQLAIAADHFQKAIEIAPGNVTATLNLGAIYELLHSYPKAELVYRNFLTSYPATAPVCNNLAQVLVCQGKIEDAIEWYRRGLELKPAAPIIYNNLGSALFQTGEQTRIKEAFQCYKKAAELNPDYTIPLSNMCMAMNYFEEFSLESMLETARESARRWQRYDLESKERLTNPERELRIGYVSGDFRTHPVAFFLRSVLREHDKSSLKVYAYHTTSSSDSLTAEIQSLVDVWRSVESIPDANLAKIIQDDEIDILVDLSGFTKGHRLGVFALKPAPIQVTWLGYFGTTGLPEMDYILADRFVLPDSHKKYYTEHVCHLPDSYLCYSPPSYKLPLTQPALLKNDYVTLGCFNNRAKITPKTMNLWARILRELPTSKLLLKYRQYEDQRVCTTIRDTFTELGVEKRRIFFEGNSNHPELLECYNKVDIALDPTPYGGGTTTAEALWMGVPVVSLLGDRWTGRVSASILSSAGLSQLIASNENDYVKKAVELAKDKEQLLSIRAALREQFQKSSICDAEKFTRGLESVFREMWRDYCRKNTSASETTNQDVKQQN